MIGGPLVLLSSKIAALSSLVMLGSIALDEKSTITISAALVMVGSTWRTARMFQKFVDSQKHQSNRLQRVEEKVDKIERTVEEQSRKREEQNLTMNLKVDELGKQRIFDMDNLRAELFGRPGPLSGATARRPASSGRLLKILLVDDDATDRQLYRRAIGGLYSVEEADSLRTAMEKSKLTHYDCILLDLYLPDSLPTETVARFLFGNPTAVCIATSGTTDNEHVNQAIKQGADSFIAKGNYDPIYLSRMIQNAMGRKALAPPPSGGATI